ncbi:Dynein regulatory complex protein 8 [Boothiomyces sp. JEL0838]|nr:Dynein regulatory complex protein 8 [Boothiomyces sp. JEL0838]
MNGEVPVPEITTQEEAPIEKPQVEIQSVEAPLPPLPVKEVESPETILLKRVRAAFDTFDQQNNSTCDVREIGTILRSLGIYPTLEQLHGWMEEDEPSGFVTWERFSKVTIRILSGTYPVKSDEETLFRAFLTLDTDKKGYLLPEELKKSLTSQGEVFTEEEIEEMLAACTDPAENKIYYEDYITILAK